MDSFQKRCLKLKKKKKLPKQKNLRIAVKVRVSKNFKRKADVKKQFFLSTKSSLFTSISAAFQKILFFKLQATSVLLSSDDFYILKCILTSLKLFSLNSILFFKLQSTSAPCRSSVYRYTYSKDTRWFIFFTIKIFNDYIKNIYTPLHTLY